MVRDETDKHLQQERARADDLVAARDAFLGIVSHDLRNMLNIVVGYAALISKDASLTRPERVTEAAERIQRSGKRMERLVADLIDLASIEAGALAAKLEPGDVGLVSAEAVENAQAQATAAGVTVELEIAPDTPAGAFDSSRILQVLTNLLGNALKFTPSGGRIVVRVASDGDEVCVAVRDSGIGIQERDLASVFTRFVQVDDQDRRGVGLGLYISQSIVRGHGGRIWAESTLGEGSLFQFTLPVATGVSPS